MNYALNKARNRSINPDANPDKSPLDAAKTSRTALPPTSSFLLNRHKILRKQDEAAGKPPAHEASVKPPLTEASVNSAAAASESEGARDAHNISTLNVIINPKFDEPIESDRPPTGRPELLPKPVIKPAEPSSPSESPTKKGRGILRVASLRGIRSRTPSPKKKEEFLEESVMYTKHKPAPPEPPLSGNRQHLLRRRPAENVTRVEVSAPQLVSTTAGGATTITIGGARAPSPAPQRTTVIPASVQGPSKVNVIVEAPPSEHLPAGPRPMPAVMSVQRPQENAGDEQTITPVYSHLSTARALLRTSVTKTTQNESSAASISSYIQPQIRPMPPRKPLRRNEITETLLEVLPQQSPRPLATEPAPPAITSSAHKETTIHIQQTASHLRPTGTRLQPKPAAPREQEVRSPSVGGNLTFDDEFDNISSSHVDYEHSSADETTEELVKRSLVKASHRNGRGTIGDIQEEGGTLVRTEESNTKSNPDQVKQPPAAFKCNYPPSTPTRTPYKPAYTSADESDSSRGGGRVSYIASSRPSRIVEPRKDTGLMPAAPIDQNNAGRRKYAERRQVLRNFEDALQRKRLTSKTSASSIDSADSNDNDSLLEGYGQRSQGMVQGGFNGRTTGGNFYDRQRTTTTTRSRYYVPSDDAASDSIGIPEPLPEYEYPNRIQGRTIQEEQQIRETVRLRAGSSSSTSSLDRSPERRYAAAQQQQERTHYSRHFEISPEELTTARSLIHHRLPPTYSEPPAPVARPLRNPSQSPARRPPHLPPPSPMHVGPVVHHSDGETRYYPEKPKKKMGIVRRLSELVRGERKSLKRGESPPTVVRNGSSSSIEQMEQRKLPEPIPAAGTLSNRRQSPVRRYQDRPLRQTAVPLSGSVERGESFTRPAAMAKNNPYRTSGNFSDATAASFAYAPVEPSPPVYAFPDKLQKRQNLRHRSMSEHDLNQPPMDSRSTFQYEDPHPVKPSKSIESLTESVHKEKYRGPLIVTQRPYEEFNQRTTKTNLIPYGKQEGFNAPVRNTARVRSPRSSMYDKVAQQYSSTPVLAPTAGMYPVMAPPLKPPRRYDMDSIARSTDHDSDLQSSLEDRIRLPAERPLERSRPELDLRAATDRSDLYSEPLSTTMDEALRSRSPVREPYPARPEKHVAEINRTPSNVQRNAEMAAMYSRTRMAANDLTNRRYHSAAGGIDQAPPVDRGRRMIPRESRPVGREMVGSGERQYKSAYRLEMQSPVAPGGTVAERSRFFNNLPAGRKEYAVRR